MNQLTASTSTGAGEIAIAPAGSGSNNNSRKRSLGADEDADGDEDAPAGASGAGKKKRNRKPVTCAQCRRRKLKCDRGYPCGACRDRQEGHLCEWEGAIRLPQPHLTRDAEAQELRLQLDRLENLLGALGGTNPALLAAAGLGGGAGGAVSAAGGEGGPNTGVAEKSAAEALGLLAANPGSPATGRSGSSSATARAQVLAQAPTVSHLIALLPMKKELEALISRFIASEVLFFPIFHVPTFNQRVKDYSNATAPEHPFFLALLFSLVAFEMAWQLTEPGLSRLAGTEKENAAKRFLEASMEALRMGSYMETPDLDVVRTLLVLSRTAGELLDPRSGYYLSQAIQIAQALGLNRDPSSAGIYNPIQLEERRKLWHILLGLDWLGEGGRLPTITTTQYDTQEPGNAFDHEITETSIYVRAFPAFTPWLYFNLHNQISVYSHGISEDVFAVKPSRPLTWGRVEELNQGLEQLGRKLPLLDFTGDSVQPLKEEQFASDRFRVQAHSTIFQLTIRLNRPFLTRGFVDYRFKEGRERCIEAAHKLLGIWLGYSDKHAISRLPSVTYHALNAMLLCSIDLFQDPMGQHAEKHKRLIGSVSIRLNAREHRSRIVTEVIRVVGLLIRISAKSPELRRTSVVPLATQGLLPSFVFARPFPLPMTLHPLSVARAPRPGVDQDPELAVLWDALVQHFPLVYAVPDREEWEELSSTGKGVRPWSGGVDLVTPALPGSAGSAAAGGNLMV
ncbi:hypothetical protein JCM8097_008749 [Rhodosporidiobolus ruineniae]